MKRLVCLVPAFLMLFGLIACSSQEDKNPNIGSDITSADVSQTTQETTVEENPFEEFLEISWLVHGNNDYVEGRWDEVELEEKFNVNLDVWAMDSNNREQMAALVAAGEIPDYFYMPASPMLPEEMYENNLTRSISFDAIQNYFPGYYALLEKVPVGFQYNLIPEKTDEFLGLTHMNINSCQYFYDAACVNLDWLEAVGYELDEEELIPVKMTTDSYSKFNDNIFFTEGKFTFEEMLDIMRAFTEDDPDGNGEDDTFAMNYLPESAWTNFTQEGLFGFVHDSKYLYKDPDTSNTVPKYAYGPYKDYLKWMSEMLNLGYIRKLPGSNWRNDYQQISVNNKNGILQISGTGYLNLVSAGDSVYPPQNILLKTDEEARFVVGPMFRGPNGDLVNCTYNIDPYGTGKNRLWLFGNQVSDEKLVRILNILQYTVFESEDNFLRFQNGQEGMHWYWDSEPYISTMIKIPLTDVPVEQRGQPFCFTTSVIPSRIAKRVDNAVKNGYWDYFSFMWAKDLIKKYSIDPEKYLSATYMGGEMFKEYEELNAEVSAEMNPVINDFKNRALNGEIADFNTEWPQYLDQLYEAGLQQLVDKFFNNPDFPKFDPGEKYDLR